MVAATKGGQKDITTLLGCEVVYLSTIANGYTYVSRFGNAKAAFFQQATTGYSTPGNRIGGVGVTISNGTVTLAVSGTITAGYLQIWGE